MKNATEQLTALRKVANHSYQTIAWPVKKDETWRRTPISLLEPESFTVATLVDNDEPTLGVLHQSYSAHVLIKDGHIQALTVSEAASSLGVKLLSLNKGIAEISWVVKDLETRVSQISDRFEAWHFSHLGLGVAVEVPAKAELENPIVIEIEENRPGVAIFPHIIVRLGALSTASVVVKYQSPDGVSLFVGSGIDYQVEEGANLQACEIQNLGNKSRHVDSSTLHMARDTHVWHLNASFGAMVTRTQGIFSLEGPGSQLKTNGIYLGCDTQHKDIRIVQNHEAPNTQSHALYKGALRDSSRTVFQGLIEVKPGANKTDAYLTNRNLILADGAKADSLPQLRIDTNDVKCSHGSTTGKVNEDEVFYLMARGFSRNEARLMIAEGLFAEIIDQAPVFLRMSLDSTIVRLLGGHG